MGGGALRTAIVLAGGKSSRIGVDKGLVILNKKPLVAYVVERLEQVVDEVILVVGSQAQLVAYEGFGPRVIREGSGAPPWLGPHWVYRSIWGYAFHSCGSASLDRYQATIQE
jgi:molybdopterin-guanine dinucleotide biosynthesis protein A